MLEERRHPPSQTLQVFTIQCSSSVTSLQRCSLCTQGQRHPVVCRYPMFQLCNMLLGFFIPSGHHTKVVSHYPVFQGCSMLPEHLFLPGSNIPSLLPRHVCEFCEMDHVLPVHPESSTLNSLSPSSVSCWWQGSDASPCTLGDTHPDVLSHLFRFWHASSASCLSWIKHTRV